MGVVGFLIARDVVRGGYPFLEAIHAALGLCEHIHVLDGESSDGTWGALQRLREIVSSRRLALRRAPWTARAGQHPLRAATNQLREQLPARPGDWLFNLQANEILTPECAGEIGDALRRFPRRVLLRLPYTTLMGLDVVIRTRHRGRLFRNDPLIESIGDAFDFGVDRARLRRSPWLAPRLLWLRARTRTVELEHPVLRFRAPLPGDYAAKLEARIQLERRPERLRAELDVARSALADARSEGLGSDAFWERIPYARASDDRDAAIPAERRLATIPAVLEALRGAWSYDVDRSLEALGRREVPVPVTPTGPDG